MLASIPASILNHIRRRTGIPPDSIKPVNALAGGYPGDELSKMFGEIYKRKRCGQMPPAARWSDQATVSRYLLAGALSAGGLAVLFISVLGEG
jgi:hypothetical protein